MPKTPKLRELHPNSKPRVRQLNGDIEQTTEVVTEHKHKNIYMRRTKKCTKLAVLVGVKL